ncbi:1707_t:CDS:2 [Dentiscutata erythropus]|uniref:1707_t:CDS:1 n=1 Tax=Dentiscutata erythropus TaxID=1348616 RepID=A0A9N9HUP8_9GLOM|nr:1707_t:CDS:2 [Dentiscutata erythropus]
MKIIQIYSILTIYLILFVALLTDAKLQCEEVSRALKRNEPIDYNVAKKCIESFTFDARFANKTIDSVLHFMLNHYPFINRAKKKPPRGFTYQPVDIAKELKLLRKKTFKSDYDFRPSNIDCEVTKIGGKPALQAMIDFANDKIASSKDLGVRFNMALAPSIETFSQKFTLREDFPETPSITYNLECPKKTPFTLERKWNITYNNGFNLFNIFCLEQNNITAFALNDNFASSSKITELATATKLTSDDGKNKVGIAVITEEKQKLEIILKNGFQELKNRGAKNNASEFIGSREKRTSNLYLNALTSDEEKILTFFSEIYNIKTIAVGGLLDTQMSFSTFPGGEVQSLNVISEFSGDNVTDVPGINALTFTIREAYDIDKNGTVKDILEYSYKPANCRLYYY